MPLILKSNQNLYIPDYGLGLAASGRILCEKRTAPKTKRASKRQSVSAQDPHSVGILCDFLQGITKYPAGYTNRP